MRHETLVLLALLAAAGSCTNMYVPGMTARWYNPGDYVNVTVNSLRSLSTIIPYDYYHLPFCQPANRQAAMIESMGQILAGDKMEASLYSVQMKQDRACVKIECGPANGEEVRRRAGEVADFIEKGYRGHMSIDNLPGFTPEDVPPFSGRCKGQPPMSWIDSAVRGYALGVPAWCTGKTMINNHLEFTVRYHNEDVSEDNTTLPRAAVVGFTIRPRSIHFTPDSDCDAAFVADRAANQPLEIEGVKDGSQKVTWSFSVKWIEDKKVTWSTRWDEYLNTSFADRNARVHWVYIINSILITLCLCVIAGMMLMRTLHKECNEYNAQDPDSLAEEMGWKLVHADVFRPPQYAELLAIGVGNGVQMVLLASAILCFSLLGFLSPSNRGGLLTALLICFALFSMASGYVTARMLKTVNRKQWKVIFGSAMIFPGTLFAAFLLIDLINWHLGASDAVPAGKIFLIFLLWVGSCVPLNVLGAAYGFHQDGLKPPCSVGRLPREIPEQRWWLAPPAVYLLPATFPFCAVFLELRFIFQSLWLGMVYYAFTFLTIVFVVWVITVMLSTVITVYYMLAYGEYRWWWRSFFIGGACGFHIYAYAIWFYFTAVNITTKTGTLIFFVYMGYFAAAYGLAAGAIGFVTSYVFVTKIYSSIRID